MLVHHLRFTVRDEIFAVPVTNFFTILLSNDFQWDAFAAGLETYQLKLDAHILVTTTVAGIAVDADYSR